MIFCKKEIHTLLINNKSQLILVKINSNLVIKIKWEEEMIVIKPFNDFLSHLQMYSYISPVWLKVAQMSICSKGTEEVNKNCLISVTSSATSHLEAHAGFFRLLIMEIRVVEFSRLCLRINILKAKLYTPSTLNIDFIQWHTQLIVCAVK